jgi:outer membrane biosynthesis protein TonB
MNRLQRQCFLASAATHGLLLLLLATGAGFVAARKSPANTMTVLTFIPDKLVDAAITGGGEPEPAPPPPQPQPAPPQPQPQPAPPQPQPQPAPQPQPPKVQRVKLPQPAPEPERVTPEGTRPVTPPKRHVVELDPEALKRSTRAVKPQPPREDPAIAEQRAAEAAAEQARRINEVRQSRINSLASGLQHKLSSTTTVTSPGPGGGGVSYANYGLFVRSIYDAAWRPPSEIASPIATATARVVIARDGHIVSAELVTKSGLAPLDKSVTAALGRVTTIGRPFPEGATEETRTFFIDFNLEAKKPLG